MKNKKAEDERILSPVFFVMLVVIGIGIVSGYVIFYSDDVNVNSDEAEILSNRIIDSIVSNGYLNERVLDDSFDIFNEAKLNKALFHEEGYFYFEIVVLQEDNVLKNIFYGNEKLKLEYQFQGKDFASGYYKEFFVIDKNNPEIVYKIKILTASKQIIE